MRSSTLLAAVTGSVAIGILGSCSAGNGGKLKGSGGAGGAPALSLGVGGNLSITGITTDLGTPLVPTCDKCSDFPATPQGDASLAGLFTAPASGAGPCLIEPQDGSLFPANWLRPRVNASGSAKAYQITFHADREINDLVVYTVTLPWEMPKDVWTNLAKNVFEEDITVTVRASTGSGAPTESKSKFRIAPVDAGGSIVFWHSTFGEKGYRTSALFGFAPGDEGVVATLYPDQVKTPIVDTNGNPIPAVPAISSNISGAIPVTAAAVPAGQDSCVGCHSATPGGKEVATTGFWPWNVAIAGVEATTTGQQPSYVTPIGALMAQSPWQGATSFSQGDWDGTHHRYVTSFAARTINADPSQSWAFWPGDANATNKDMLMWVDLSAQGTMPTGTGANFIGAALVPLQNTLWGIIARDGDARGAVTPNWSHDASKIAYTSTDSTASGRVGPAQAGGTPATEIDIYTVPFNGGKGGAATPLASEKGVAEYYPSFSPDDKYVAYNRVGKIDSSPMYYRPEAELFIIPSGGGDKVRLDANDPPQCTGLTTATIHNSWAKWSPHPKAGNGATYYFMTFSSSRYTKTLIADTYTNTRVASELYLTAVKVDAAGKITTYPAIYMWNQNNLVSTDAAGTAIVTQAPGLNVTPAWEEFEIPPVPPVVPK